uniref:Secreted protein n=1 Tax=Rhipicephalus appendiculatus TaxID=34631 RepID=A0A131YRT0_RHIAP
MNATFFILALLFIGLTHFSNFNYVEGDTKKRAMAAPEVEIENTYRSSLKEQTFESRTGQNKRQRRRSKKNGTDRMKPVDVQVTCAGKIPVTIATFGTNTTTGQVNYTGDWSEHRKCLMPCDPKHPNSCKSLPGDNCTCFSRLDYPSWGTCAVKGIPLGNNDYNMSSV